MRIAYFTGPRKIEILDGPEPRIEQPDQVKVRIDRVGVCGSDVHYYTHGGIGDQRLEYPTTIGHECSGTIVEAGESALLKPGTRVAIDPAIVCGTCDQCRAGRINTCRNIQFMGAPGEAPGAIADFCVLPAINCAPMPGDFSLDLGVLAEPLTIGLHAEHLAKLGSAERVAILGVGPIGLSVLLCVKAIGAPSHILVTDLHENRLEVARQFEADQAILAADLEPPALHEDEFDVVFECSGDPDIIDTAMSLATPGGRIVLVGIPTTTRYTFNAHKMRRTELTFQAVRRQCNCLESTVELLTDQRIDPSPMLTHQFPLEEITEAFEMVAGYKDGVIKAVISLSAAD